MPQEWRGFIRTPRRYKEAARIVDALNNTPAKSLQTLVESSRLPNKTQLAALVIRVCRKLPILEAVVSQSPLLDLPKSLALVLVHEALFGERPFPPGMCARGDQVLACRPQLEKALAAVSKEALPVSLPRYARVNTLLLNTSTVIQQLERQGFRWVRYPRRRGLDWFLERVRHLQPHEFLKDFHLRDWLVFGSGAKLNTLDLVKNLQVLLQDKASGMAVIALDPRPGAVVLDACAAPGMKTSYAAALMDNRGKILAVDRSSERLEVVRHLCSTELILVDPSCSGTGLCDRPGKQLDPESAEGQERLQRLTTVQSKLLMHALDFPRCRRVVYSTCSVLRQENEDVVEYVLARSNGRFCVGPCAA
ncbi:hypothetical protein MRX96_004016 [Rhipicephalus microplus]